MAAMSVRVILAAQEVCNSGHVGQQRESCGWGGVRAQQELRQDALYRQPQAAHLLSILSLWTTFNIAVCCAQLSA